MTRKVRFIAVLVCIFLMVGVSCIVLMALTNQKMHITDNLEGMQKGFEISFINPVRIISMKGVHPIVANEDVVMARKNVAIGPRIRATEKGEFLLRPFSTNPWVPPNEPICFYYTALSSSQETGEISMEIVDNSGTLQGIKMSMGHPPK